jgi:Putative zinc-finger
MRCDEVRLHLAEHVLGSLPDELDANVRAHLRGCMTCRQERAALDEGVSTLARAAHQVDPPESLKARVLGVLEEERSESPAPRRNAWPVRRIAIAAAAAIVVAASVGTAAWQGQRASHYEGLAGNYRNFLHALGGKDVRVGTLHAVGSQEVQGSVVMYDSDKGQSWVLVLVHAPGESGEGHVTIASPKRTIGLHPLRFDAGGEASTWLVTGSDISRFDRVRIMDTAGNLLATGRAQHE